MPTQHALHGLAKRMFARAIDQRTYGITANPCANLRPTKLFGPKLPRARTFSEDELLAFQRVVKRLPYPHGPAYLMLLLTALRLNEVADARWSEFDLRNRVWEIPATRMKSTNDKARAHAVPLTTKMMQLLEALPRFKSGDYVFSTTHGIKPVWRHEGQGGDRPAHGANLARLSPQAR